MKRLLNVIVRPTVGMVNQNLIKQMALNTMMLLASITICSASESANTFDAHFTKGTVIIRNGITPFILYARDSKGADYQIASIDSVGRYDLKNFKKGLRESEFTGDSIIYCIADARKTKRFCSAKSPISFIPHLSMMAWRNIWCILFFLSLLMHIPKVRDFIIKHFQSLVVLLAINLVALSGANGQTIDFKEGTINYYVYTNSITAKGETLRFTKDDVPNLDFTGVEDPQVTLVLYNYKLKPKYSKKGGYDFIIKEEWINNTRNLRGSKKTLRINKAYKKKIHFRVTENGSAAIGFNYAILKPRHQDDVSLVKHHRNSSEFISFRVSGIPSPVFPKKDTDIIKERPIKKSTQRKHSQARPLVKRVIKNKTVETSTIHDYPKLHEAKVDSVSPVASSIKLLPSSVGHKTIKPAPSKRRRPTVAAKVMRELRVIIPYSFFEFLWVIFLFILLGIIWVLWKSEDLGMHYLFSSNSQSSDSQIKITESYSKLKPYLNERA